MTARLSRLLGIDLPIVLGPFGGLSSVELTALVSERGGLGSYGLYGYDADRIRDTVAQLRRATSRSFALNLWLPLDDEPDASAADLERMTAVVAGFFDELGMPAPERPERYLPPLSEQIAAALEAEPAAVSVVYGVPDPALIADAHRRSIVVIGTATTVAEAIALEHGGVDAVVATGAEAAGHRVSFLAAAEDSIVGTFALVPQVVDAVSIPVIAAGGIADRRGVAAARALGADGVQVGTAFLRTTQSAANDAHRHAITTTAANESILTRAMSGRLARGAPNKATRAIESAGAILPFPAQNWLTGQFRAEATRRGVGDLQSLWLGQASPLARFDDADAVFDELSRGFASP